MEVVTATERALMTMVCYQQINATLGFRLQSRLEEKLRTGTKPSSYDLVQLGFSARKAQTIVNIFTFFAKESYTPGKLPTDNVISLLTQIKGVGPWTAKAYLLFYEKREDVVLYEDLDVRKGLKIEHHLEKVPTPKQAKDLCKDWQPDISSALSVFYLDLGKTLAR